MSGQSPAWCLGDRLPDVRLQLADGQRMTLHAEFAGLPLWLCVVSQPAQAGLLPEPPPGVRALCVGRDMIEGIAPGWRGCIVDSIWRAGLGMDCLWEADANLRLRAHHPLPLSSVLSAPAAPTPLVSSQTLAVAPVLLIPDVFEHELCERLVTHLEVDCEGGSASGVVVFEHGKPTFQLDSSIKQRRESPPRDPQLEARMHERLTRRALPEIARAFNFATSRRDPFKLLAYPENAGYFNAHRDNETADVAYRRFALSVNLNAGDYVGGEFRFPEFGPHLYAPPTGGAIVFSCSLLHEVLPVKRGMRYAMTTFLA